MVSGPPHLRRASVSQVPGNSIGTVTLDTIVCVACRAKLPELVAERPLGLGLTAELLREVGRGGWWQLTQGWVSAVKSG